MLWIRKCSLVLSITIILVICLIIGKEMRKDSIDNSQLIISEVCHNFSAFDEGNFSDYIEIYNTSQNDIDIDGYFIGSDRDLDKVIRLEGRLQPGEIKLVLIEDITSQNKLKNCKFGEYPTQIYLNNINGEIIDQVNVPILDYNLSYSYCNLEDQWQVERPSPYVVNQKGLGVASETLSKPTYSVESGFYEEELLLELISDKEDGIIYYTLDGSTPTQNSEQYTEPILVTDASKHDNVYSSIKEVSTKSDYWNAPDKPIDKCTVIRAVVYSKDGKEKSAIETKSYFVGFDAKGYDDFSFVSLVSDPVGLFSDETGIYATGDVYKNYLEVVSEEERNSIDWKSWDANYRERGKAWEREASIELFDEDRQYAGIQDVGIRIKGNASRVNPQKSFNIYAREIYGKKDFSNLSTLMEVGKSRITLFAGGQDSTTKIRDVLVSDLCSNNLEYSIMSFKPCYVFLNGEYWGLYYLTEKLDEYYIEEKYGVPLDDVLIIKNDSVEAGGTEAEKAYEELLNYVLYNDMSDMQNFQELCEMIDINSFIDYYATQIFLGHCKDWPNDNYAMWRSASGDGEGYKDKKWRWMLFDMNWAGGVMSDRYTWSDTIQYITEENKDILFSSVINNVQFQKDFSIRFCDIANVYFDIKEVEYSMEELKNLMKASVLRDYDRYYSGIRSVDEFDEAIDDMYNFFSHRKEGVERLF